MDGNRFDEMTRRLGQGRSRRSMLKGLAGAALGAAGLARFGAAEAASNKNSACAQFCAQVFGANTTAAGQCTSQAAKGTGPCVQCTGNAARYCNGACVDLTTDPNNCGACNASCDDGDLCTTDACSAGHCVHTPVTCTGGDECNTPTCDEALGCTTTPLSGTACTGGTCQSGTCVPDCVPARTCGPTDDCREIDGGTCLGVCFTECGPANVGNPCGAGCVACTCTAVLDDPFAPDPTYSYFCAVGVGACESAEGCPADTVCAWNEAATAGTCVRACPSFP